MICCDYKSTTKCTTCMYLFACSSAHNGDNYNPDHLQNQKSAQSAESQQDNKHKGAELNGSHDDDTPSGAEPNREATPTEVEHNGEVRDNPSDENSEHLNDADGQQNADEENTSQVDDVNQPMNDLNLDDPAEAADDVSETAADDAVDNTENDVTPTTAAEGDDSGHDEPADNVQNTDDA